MSDTVNVEAQLVDLVNNFGKAKTAAAELMSAAAEFRDKILELHIDKFETPEFTMKVRHRKPRKSFDLKAVRALPKEELAKLNGVELLEKYTKLTEQRPTVYIRPSDLTKKVAEAIALAQKFGQAAPKFTS